MAARPVAQACATDGLTVSDDDRYLGMVDESEGEPWSTVIIDLESGELVLRDDSGMGDAEDDFGGPLRGDRIPESSVSTATSSSSGPLWRRDVLGRPDGSGAPSTRTPSRSTSPALIPAAVRHCPVWCDGGRLVGPQGSLQVDSARSRLSRWLSCRDAGRRPQQGLRRAQWPQAAGKPARPEVHPGCVDEPEEGVRSRLRPQCVRASSGSSRGVPTDRRGAGAVESFAPSSPRKMDWSFSPPDPRAIDY